MAKGVTEILERYHARQNLPTGTRHDVRTNLRLSPELVSRIDRLAEELDDSRNSLMAQLLDAASADLCAVLARDEGLEAESETALEGGFDEARYDRLMYDPEM